MVFPAQVQSIDHVAPLQHAMELAQPLPPLPLPCQSRGPDAHAVKGDLHRDRGGPFTDVEEHGNIWLVLLTRRAIGGGGGYNAAHAMPRRRDQSFAYDGDSIVILRASPL